MTLTLVLFRHILVAWIIRRSLFALLFFSSDTMDIVVAAVDIFDTVFLLLPLWLLLFLFFGSIWVIFLFIWSLLHFRKCLPHFEIMNSHLNVNIVVLFIFICIFNKRKSRVKKDINTSEKTATGIDSFWNIYVNIIWIYWHNFIFSQTSSETSFITKSFLKFKGWCPHLSTPIVVARYNRERCLYHWVGKHIILYSYNYI